MTASIPAALTVRNRRLELAGIPTAVLEGGEGSPIVLLDGLGEAASTSMRVILGLAETHRVIVPDLPAQGHPRALAWLSELIACRRAERPALVAYAPGGAIAARFAIERGEALRALVLVNTLGGPTVAADDLARIDISTTLIWGSGAEAAALRAAEETSERHGWPLRVIDDCRNPALDRPAELLRALHVALGRTVTYRPGSRPRSRPTGMPIQSEEEPMHADQTQPTFSDIADAIAPGWERRRAFVDEVAAPVAEWMIRALDPQPGHTVLELAAGAGDTGYDVASIVGAEGRLISSDVSPAMLDVARRRAGERGVDANVEHRVIDAERIELADDSVDGVLCRFAYMLMADPAAALAETRRVLRPGGRLALAVFGPPQTNPFFSAVVMALVSGGHMPPPDPTAPGIFSMAAAERTQGLLEGAGFGSVQVEEVPLRFPVADAGEHLAIVADAAGPIAMVLRGLSDDEREAVRARLEETLAHFATDGGYELPGLALVAVAR